MDEHEKPREERELEGARDVLRAQVRFFYDLQRLRIATMNRIVRAVDKDDSILPPKARKWFEIDAKLLHDLELHAVKIVDSLCSRWSVYPWLKECKGVGPTMSGVLLSEFDIHKAVRPSQFWSFSGLHVVNGKAPKPKKGEKLRWNRWLRSKIVFVLAGCLIKANNETYRPIYDGYKFRLQNRLGPCELCGDTGKAKDVNGKIVACWNCDGGKLAGRAPWGKGAAHRNRAALRYMVKQFIADFWRAWRVAEELPTVPTYAEAKLLIKHVE